ncbi:MAG: 7-cyano-7-deazaguanine synthase QueC [Muribaculaceae bacterium]|nr:7-cyano-7-deazaguanine synthase QueC [Muribaculaceae bacterium]
MKDKLLVYSGGLDSTTMLHEYADDIAVALFFNYGSNHNDRESLCARVNCEKLGIEFLEIPLGFMSLYFKSSLLEGADAIPEGNYDEENMKSTVVPFRNGIMLSIAAGIAESRGLNQVMIANHAGDHAIYPDCRPDFISAMSAAIAAGTYEGIDIFAPYTSLTKAQIVARGAKINVDYSDTYSCYRGGERHCGRCGTCRERIEAFRLAGVDDPTDYE